MKILIIRHGDPDYEHDSLTPKGFREADYLSERIGSLPIDRAYVSPLGRAKDTAAPSLKKLGMEATELDWLREFDLHRIWRPDVKDRRMIAWDWLPADWMQEPCFFQADHWMEHPLMAEAGIGDYYREVTGCFDSLLAENGYIRTGAFYRVERENRDTIALFCHYGVQIVMLSHLLNVSPMVLWHGVVAAPTSVTTLVTEERRQGTAIFRCMAFGDISHLYIHQEPPAFAARFCENYQNTDERHD